MRLVNQNNQPIVEFTESGTVFHNRFLESEMRSMGIMIPHGLRGSYHGRDCIHLGDEDFERAFKEIYYLTQMDRAQFKWLR